MRHQGTRASRWERYKFWAQSSWVWFQGHLIFLGVALFEPEQEQVMYMPQGASGGKTRAGGISKRQATGSTGSCLGAAGEQLAAPIPPHAYLCLIRGLN